jgi:hypothetical protein
VNYAIVTAEHRGRLWTRRVARLWTRGVARLWTRRTASVVAGLVTILVASSAVDFVLEFTGVLPGGALYDTGLLLVATAYRTLISIFGCYIAARLAPDRRLRHALALGALGVLLSTLAAIANTQLHLSPNWYPIGLILVALPSAWAGGKLALLTQPRERVLATGERQGVGQPPG